MIRTIFAATGIAAASLGAAAPAAATPTVYSQLINVSLPAGSTGTGGTPVHGIEVWHVPLEPADEMANLAPQLPIRKPYYGLRWCADDSGRPEKFSQWSWGGVQETIVVTVDEYYPTIGVRGPGSDVTIQRGPDPNSTGCS
jgi:hypothetical protein